MLAVDRCERADAYIAAYNFLTLNFSFFGALAYTTFCRLHAICSI